MSAAEGRIRQRESGFAMLLVFLMAAFLAISLYMQIPRIAFQAQRQKEQLLIERGQQYKRAIQVFVRTNGRYPGKIEDLENFNNRRFLRHRFVDPMTGKTEWRLIHINGGVFTDSIVNKSKLGQQNNAAANNFVGEQAYLANDTTSGTPGVAGAAGRRRASEGGAAPLGPDGQPLFGANGAPPGSGVPGGPNFNGQLPGADPQANLNGQLGAFPGNGQPGNAQFGAPQQFNPGLPGVPGFPPGTNGNPNAPNPDASNPNFGGRAFQPRQVFNQQGLTQPDSQQGGNQQPGFQQPGFPPGVQPGGIQQPGFQQGAVPFGGQGVVNNQAAVGNSSFVGASSSFVGSSGSFVGGGGSGSSLPNPGTVVPANPNPAPFPNSFPNSPQNPGFGQNPNFGQNPGFGQQAGVGQQPLPQQFDPNSGNPNNQPNLPPGGTPYGQPNPGAQNAAANLINGILTSPRQGGQPGNPAPGAVGQQIGGGVAGVASTAEADSIMVYNERTKYNEWEFIFDLSKQRGLMNPNMQGQIVSAPLAVGTGAPGMPVSGPATTTAVPAGAQVPVQPLLGGGAGAGGAGPVMPGQGLPGQGLPGQVLPGQQAGGLPPGFRLGRP